MSCRRIFVKIVGVGVGVAMLVLNVPFVHAQEVAGSSEGTTASISQITAPHVDGEVLVKFKKEKINISMVSGSASLNSFAFAKGLRKDDVLKPQNISVMVSKEGESTEALIDRLQDDPRVQYVEPNYLRKISEGGVTPRLVPNDLGMDLQWGLDNSGQSVNGVSGLGDADISAPEAWSIFTGSSSVVVGVLDTGISLTHPDLVDNLWDGSSGCKDDTGAVIVGGCPNHGWDFVSHDNDPSDDHGHGTHVASIVGARGDNTEGVAGVNWKVQLMALKVADSQGFVSSDDWIKGLNFAKQNGVKIVNASFGGSSFSQAEDDAIKNFDGVFVAAAGNSATNTDVVANYPSGYPEDNIIAVAATDQNDALASFSNFGVSSVDVAAPGKNILGAFPGDAYAFLSGTSMASPHVAGLAALLWGYDPSLTAEQVRRAIIKNGDEITSLIGKVSSGMRINAAALMNAPIMGALITKWTMKDDLNGGVGKLDVSFGVFDGIGGVPLTLHDFQYSVDGGVSFVAPVSGDSSPALPANWASNSYVTSTPSVDIAPLPEMTFTVDLNSADLAFVSHPLPADLRIRFKVSNALTSTDFLVTDDVIPSTAVLTGVPASIVVDKTANVVVSGDGVAEYAYTLDTGSQSAFAPVATPITLSGLSDGAHSLKVFGKDISGNVQLKSTDASWTVDTTPPVGTVMNSSDLPLKISKPILKFTLSDAGIGVAGAKISLSCDDVSYGDPIAYADTIDTFDVKSGANGCSASDGAHTVFAKFSDSLGNVSVSVKTDAFVVHTGPVVAEILTKPDSVSVTASPTFTIGGVFVTAYKYQLDTAAFSDETVVSVPLALSGLANGSHTISFIGKDDVGIFQPDNTAVTYAWTVAVPVPPAPVVVAPIPAPVVSSPVSSGGGGGGGGGGFSAPIFASTPVVIPPVVLPKKGIVLGAHTINLVDGLILKVEGRGLYYIVSGGTRRPLPYATYRKKYLKTSPSVSIPADVLKDIPTFKIGKK